MTGTMKAVAKVGARPGAELIEAPIPTPGPGEVLVKVKVSAICGTDVHIYSWDPWAQSRIKPPLIFGHEFCGTVVELGQGVKRRSCRRFCLGGDAFYVWHLSLLPHRQRPHL